MMPHKPLWQNICPYVSTGIESHVGSNEKHNSGLLHLSAHTAGPNLVSGMQSVSIQHSFESPSLPPPRGRKDSHWYVLPIRQTKCEPGDYELRVHLKEACISKELNETTKKEAVRHQLAGDQCKRCQQALSWCCQGQFGVPNKKEGPEWKPNEAKMVTRATAKDDTKNSPWRLKQHWGQGHSKVRDLDEEQWEVEVWWEDEMRIQFMDEM